MRIARLIIYECDGKLAAALRPLADERGWSLREPRRLGTVLKLLERGGPNLLLVRVGRDLEREFTVLARACERHPEADVVLVCDSDHPRLVGLAWDLGATYVLTADHPRERLVELVERLLRAEG